ncbi:hypothetical protein EJB05_10120 [Eragrostis curvula]|uniref:Uncharacterized protein n=1 Tax=Eragrostis curvula TaxID=38414 RepID=A0A5J9W892_9POAL|nr:hypothetical protein EJB05_10120 [Eragrostis curvula]
MGLHGEPRPMMEGNSRSRISLLVSVLTKFLLSSSCNPPLMGCLGAEARWSSRASGSRSQRRDPRCGGRVRCSHLVSCPGARRHANVLGGPHKFSIAREPKCMPCNAESQLICLLEMPNLKSIEFIIGTRVISSAVHWKALLTSSEKTISYKILIVLLYDVKLEEIMSNRFRCCEHFLSG